MSFSFVTLSYDIILIMVKTWLSLLLFTYLVNKRTAYTSFLFPKIIHIKWLLKIFYKKQSNTTLRKLISELNWQYNKKFMWLVLEEITCLITLFQSEREVYLRKILCFK